LVHATAITLPANHTELMTHPPANTTSAQDRSCSADRATSRAVVMAGMVLASVWAQVAAASHDARDDIEHTIGSPVELKIEPGTVALHGTRTSAQLIVTGRYSDGSLRDLTNLCRYETLDPAIIQVSPAGTVRPLGNGQAMVRALAAGRQAEV